MATLLRCFKAARKNDSAQATQDPGGVAQKKLAATETWILVYDGVVDQVAALDAAGLPVAGRVYAGMFCTRVQPRRMSETPYCWEVLVDYERKELQDADNATVWNLNISRSSAAREETVRFDRLDLPLVNTVGDFFPQLPTITLYDAVYNISWSTSATPTGDFGEMEGKTNSDSFGFTICGVGQSFEKGQVKCVGAGFSTTKIITSTDGTTRQTSYIYECQISIQVRKPKWRWSAPNEGYYGFVESRGGVDWGLVQFPTQESDPNSYPKSVPTALNREGFALEQGAQKLKIPDDVIGDDPGSAGRAYPEDGAFELERQTEFSPLFGKLHD